MHINPVNQQLQNQSFGVRPQIKWHGEDIVQPENMFHTVFADLFDGIFNIRARKANNVNKLFNEVDPKTPKIMNIIFCVDDYYNTYRAEINTYGHHENNWPERRLFEPEIAFIKRVCKKAIEMNNAIEKEPGKTA